MRFLYATRATTTYIRILQKHTSCDDTPPLYYMVNKKSSPMPSLPFTYFPLGLIFAFCRPAWPIQNEHYRRLLPIPSLNAAYFTIISHFWYRPRMTIFLLWSDQVIPSPAIVIISRLMTIILAIIYFLRCAFFIRSFHFAIVCRPLCAGHTSSHFLPPASMPRASERASRYRHSKAFFAHRLFSSIDITCRYSH